MLSETRELEGKSLELIRLILNSIRICLNEFIQNLEEKGNENRCSSNIKLDRELSQLVPFNTEFQIIENTCTRVALEIFIGHRAKITPHTKYHTIFTVFPSRLHT